jgi:DNA modification methylase
MDGTPRPADASSSVWLPNVSRTLYYGDNLEVMRQLPSETVDLIYLDPPFNSSADYNVIFREHSGTGSGAQITAFDDTWQWGSESARQLDDLVQVHGDLAVFLDQTVQRLGHNALSAYLVMMAPRLFEMHRLLKPTGSLYLHCDPTASHYLKVLLDVVFGARRNFRSEVVWKRTHVPTATESKDVEQRPHSRHLLLHEDPMTASRWNPATYRTTGVLASGVQDTSKYWHRQKLMGAT